MVEAFDRCLCKVKCGNKKGEYCGGHHNYSVAQLVGNATSKPRYGFIRCTTEDCPEGCLAKTDANRYYYYPKGALFRTTVFMQHAGVINNELITTTLNEKEIPLVEWLKIQGNRYFTSGEISVGSRIKVLDREGRNHPGRITHIREGDAEHLAKIEYFDRSPSETLNLAQEVFHHLTEEEVREMVRASPGQAIMAAAAAISPSTVSDPSPDEAKLLREMQEIKMGETIELNPFVVQRQSAPDLLSTPGHQALVPSQQLQRSMSSRKRRCMELTEEINKLNSNLDNRVEELEKENAELKRKLAAGESAARELQQLQRERDDAVNRADAAIREKQDETERFRSQLEELYAAIREKDGEKDVLQNQLEELDKNYLGVVQELSAKEQELKDFENSKEREVKEALKDLQKRSDEFEQCWKRCERKLKGVQKAVASGNSESDSSFG